ncbi:MAG: hypothetical protein ABJD11_08370 [Gemmatimonadota bacterium]
MRSLSYALLLAALCGCGNEDEMTRPAVSMAANGSVTQYSITTLGTLAGTSRGNSIANDGSVAGYSSLADLTRHAVLWRGGALLDLGTLGGANSSVVWPGQNEMGTIVGVSETSTPDPLHEAWSCAAFFFAPSGQSCVGFAWEGGRMHPLPTLGGTNGFATEVNNRGQIVGWAENQVHDPTCTAPQVLQFRAVLWEPKRRHMEQLRPLAGDSTSAATAINDHGQVVGISGDCNDAVGKFSARHAVIWDHGTVTDIGNLGGVAWNTPMAINEAGQVVGFSDTTGDFDGTIGQHAFRWTRQDGIHDLGVLPGDAVSEAHGINDRGQIVGISCDVSGACHGVVWLGGVITALDSLVTPGFAGRITFAQDINDAGVITGRLFDPVSGKNLAFVATPTRKKQ